MIAGVGRGSPRSVSCGHDFTIVACFPYMGPTEEELIEVLAAAYGSLVGDVLSERVSDVWCVGFRIDGRWADGSG